MRKMATKVSVDQYSHLFAGKLESLKRYPNFKEDRKREEDCPGAQEYRHIRKPMASWFFDNVPIPLAVFRSEKKLGLLANERR
jgi:hypothetical protein